MIKKFTVCILILSFFLTWNVDVTFSAPRNFEDPAGAYPEDSLANYGDAQMPAREAASPSDRITLELKGVNVLDVLKIIAKRSGLNIVAGRDVRGDVTLYMQDVEVKKALDTIVQTLGLAYDDKEGIITVMSNKEFVSKYGKPFKDDRVQETFKLKYANPQTMSQLVQQMKSPSGKVAVDEKTGTIIATDIRETIDEMRKTIQEFDQPLVTKSFFLKYGKAADIGDELKDYSTPNVGLIKMDKRVNQITVTDRTDIVDHIESVINAFDRRPLQVLIEAKVVEVQLYDAFRFGIDWNYVDLKAGQIRNVSLTPAQTVSAPGAALGSGSLSTFTIGTSAGNDTLQTVINILSNVGKTNILSSPRLLCLNNEEAKLAVATKQPYVTQTISLNTTTQNSQDDVKFIDVGVTMSIVPTISDDGNVVLKVKPEVSTQSSTPFTVQGVASGSDTLFDRTKVPVVTSQSLETTIIVKDGATVVIGGLIQDTEAKIRKKLPILADIPWIGAAFRTETNNFNKTELVVFLTPHVVSGKNDSLEKKKYIQEEDQSLKSFNEVGGYDFTKAEGTSPQGALRMDDKPYYETLREERPVYFPSRDSAVNVVQNQGNFNQYENEKPVETKTTIEVPVVTKKAETPTAAGGSTVSPAVMTALQARKKYREMVSAAVVDALNIRRDLGAYPLAIEVFMIIEKDGKLTMKKLVKDKGLTPAGKEAVLDTIGKLSPFPPFPSEMQSERELLDLRIDLN
jgi:MSHA type pilus biogenesis protein MshL